MVSVLTLRDQAKQRANMERKNFIKPDEWIGLISAGYKELYDILVARFEDWFTIKGDPFSVASGVSSAPLPADFYKLRGVDRSNDGSYFFPIDPFNFQNRNRQGSYLRRGRSGRSVEYRIMKNDLIFEPYDQAEGTYRLWYIPLAADLTSETDIVDGVNGWEEYIVLYAAIKALSKEETDNSELKQQKAEIFQRIEWMAQNRDAGATERVTDVTSGYSEPGLYW